MRGELSGDPAIDDLVAALGLEKSDLQAASSGEAGGGNQVSFCRTGPRPRQEENFLGPAAIIEQLRKLGQAVPEAAPTIGMCIDELQGAVRLVTDPAGAARTGGWRIKSMPAQVATEAENTERVAMLLGHAFSLVTNLPVICVGKKGYDVADFGRLEASLEKLCDSPWTLAAAVKSEGTKKNREPGKTLNR